MRRYEEIFQEVKGIFDGSVTPTRHEMIIEKVGDFSPEEIKQIRASANMTQQTFAACIGVSKKAVEAWEGGRSRPDGAARRTLGLMQKNPRFADEVGVITR